MVNGNLDLDRPASERYIISLNFNRLSSLVVLDSRVKLSSAQEAFIPIDLEAIEGVTAVRFLHHARNLNYLLSCAYLVSKPGSLLLKSQLRDLAGSKRCNYLELPFSIEQLELDVRVGESARFGALVGLEDDSFRACIMLQIVKLVLIE